MLISVNANMISVIGYIGIRPIFANAIVQMIIQNIGDKLNDQ